MDFQRHIAFVFLVMLALVLFTAGCEEREVNVKTTTKYTLNRDTNQVEGTLVNNDVEERTIKTAITVECKTLMGKTYTSETERSGPIKPGESITWTSKPLPELSSGDSYTTCSVAKIDSVWVR